ncbi:synthesis of vitamin B12 adenosyl cobalamide [Salmonella enterica subsp. enterica]|nr:synthesis of vitamin B12 adenosyl cobalamide [Salmonella enterica subsp. enterica]
MAIAHIPLALVSMDGDTFWIFVGRRDNGLSSASAASRKCCWLAYLLGRNWIGITRAGVVTANETFWRSLTALSATLWLVMNLPFPQLISLLKRAHIPRLLTEQILVNVALSLYSSG